MVLPEHITTEAIRETAHRILDAADGIPNTELDKLDDQTGGFIEVVADEVAARFDLDPEQAEELQERIVWRLELLE